MSLPNPPPSPFMRGLFWPLLTLPLILGTAGRGVCAGAALPTVPDVGRTAISIVSGIHGVFTQPPRAVPTAGMPGGPLAGNGDVGLVVGGPPDHLRFYFGKADFFGVIRGGIMPVGSLTLTVPALQGASYRMQQNIGPATLTGQFTAPDGSALAVASWVATSDNRTVIRLHNTGTEPLTLSSQLLDSWGTPGNAATYGSSAGETWLDVSPDTVDVTLGNRLHGAPPNSPSGAFQGQLADVCVYNQSVPLMRWNAAGAATVGQVALDPTGPHGGTATFTGAPQAAVDMGALCIPQRQFSVTAWVLPQAASGQQFLVSAMSDPYHPRNYPYQRGLALDLLDGKLSATLNHTTVTAPDPLPVNQWSQVAVTYDAHAMTVWADGKALATTRDFPTAQQVMGYDQEAIHLGDKDLPFDGCAPQGLLIQRVVGAATTDAEQGLQFTLAPGGEATVVLAAVTDRNTPDYAAAAHHLVEQTSTASLARLYRQHVEWWNDFWSKSFVQIPDQQVQKSWYASLYLLACCSRPGSPPPGLWGNFTSQRLTGWQGDYTLDYNYEAPFWAAYPTNHLALAENYEGPLLDYLPRGKAIAAHYGYQGLFYYTHLIPSPGWDDDPSKFMSQKSGILFGVLDCVMRWRYTRDPQYAREVYPLLRGVADFWDHYLVLQNGLYVDPHDGATEGPEVQNSPDTNTATTLAFLRQLYPALLDMSRTLKVDAGQRARWADILAHLSPLPIVPAATADHIRKRPPTTTLGDLLGASQVQGRLALRDTESGTGLPIPGLLFQGDRIQSTSPGMNSLQAVFPGWAIGIESGARARQAALDTATIFAQWFDFNNDCTFYPAAACAGYDPASILQHLDLMIQDHSFPNFAFATGGGGTENFAIVPATLSAMFLQSYQQDIHLFPDWPTDQDAAFGQLNAVGGFLISSRISQARVAYVQVQSQAGQECRVANPWPGERVRLSSGAGRTVTLQGAVLDFPTEPGQVFLLTPGRPG